MDLHYTHFDCKGIFGNYPTQDRITELELLGVTHFIDVTNINESGFIKYKTSKTYISYPIEDMSCPSNNQSFFVFITELCEIIKNTTIYIHCRGGHGRSGVVVACMLMVIYKIAPNYALYLTRKCHNNRNMKRKWKVLGSPQTKEQKKFVYDFYIHYIINGSI